MTNKDGKWIKNGIVSSLIDPSIEWKNKNKNKFDEDNVKREKLEKTQELKQLDIIIPIIIENIIKHTNYIPTDEEQIILDRKEELRKELKNI